VTSGTGEWGGGVVQSSACESKKVGGNLTGLQVSLYFCRSLVFGSADISISARVAVVSGSETCDSGAPSHFK
jgi:hypothetical protein